MSIRAALVLGFLTLARADSAVDVTGCGQAVAAGDAGTLRQDLRCGALPFFPFSAQGVHLAPGATLDLNGFSITGDGTGVGVSCASAARRRRAPCTLRGPGAISGFWAGINGGGCVVAASDLVLRANVNGVVIPKSGFLIATRVVASDNTEIGLWATDVRAREVEVNRNGREGLMSFRLLDVAGLVARENGREGVRHARFTGGRVFLADAVVLDNDRLGNGYDITATGRVHLVRTTCGRSARLRYPNWRRGDETVLVVGSYGCRDDRRRPAVAAPIAR